jgi:dihydrofolate reductase
MCATGSRISDRIEVGIKAGASIGQQFLAAGLVDEIDIHLVPVLFGSGTRMFENINNEHIQLEPLEVINTPQAMHLRYRIMIMIQTAATRRAMETFHRLVANTLVASLTNNFVRFALTFWVYLETRSLIASSPAPSL